jgi:hypothetical protein
MYKIINALPMCPIKRIRLYPIVLKTLLNESMTNRNEIIALKKLYKKDLFETKNGCCKDNICDGSNEENPCKLPYNSYSL